MTRQQTRDRGFMGVAIVAVLGFFLALHLILPEVTLLPALLVTLVVVTMLVAHSQKNRRQSHRLARASSKSDN